MHAGSPVVRFMVHAFGLGGSCMVHAFGLGGSMQFCGCT